MEPAGLRGAAPLLFGAAVLLAGCSGDDQHDIKPSEVELSDQDQSETGGAVADEDSGEPGEPTKSVHHESGIIPGHYIVMLKDSADPRAVAASVQATPEHLYNLAITGFAGPLSQRQLEALETHADVVMIEPDQVVTAANTGCPGMCPLPPTEQTKAMSPDYAPVSPPYSVRRIDQRTGIDNSYWYTCNGEDVNIFIFDTWMYLDHFDFDPDRVSLGYDSYPGQPSTQEMETCSGHGTHVAALAGGKYYGVAKGANLISIEVLDCDGDGTWSRLLDGIEWLRANKGQTPAVANMSLEGGWSWSVNRAVNRLADDGVFVVVAAGNNNGNACWYSPSGASGAMVVAACNSQYERASFSNYGSCVDIYASGTNVWSAWPRPLPFGGAAAATGTSMSSPVVAGVGALYKQTFGDDDSDVIKSYLETWATQDVIVNNPASTANRAIFWPCAGPEL